MHETSPPPNPFASPHAVDPPNAGEKWRPRWREILIGLLIAPIFFPIAVSILGPMAVVAREFYVQGELRSVELVPVQMLLFLWLVPSILAIVLGLPVSALLRRRGCFNARSVLGLGVVMSIVSIIHFIAIHSRGNAANVLNIYAVSEIIWGSFSVMATFAAFALYLAHLRRRDLRRSPPLLE